jgi:Glycosyl hydrolases family 28
LKDFVISSFKKKFIEQVAKNKMNFKSVLKMLRASILKCVFIITSIFSTSMVFASPPKIKITIAPNQPLLITTIIQKAIDSCGENGGGVVFFPAGKYLTGGIQLKSKVTLQTQKGTIIQGSTEYSDYKNDAFIFGENLTDIAILGEGIIDGVDCKNLKGEEGFRGPHCVRLVYCKNILIKGITIKNSGNWAINCRYCSNAVVENISIRAGHDGLHTRFCSKFNVTGCDFRTGDDAVAGNDNQDFLVTDCKINTSCNGFRFGCYNFTVKRCKFWGPGEYIHKLQGRNNMLTAFVHFSPQDESPQLQSGNWLIEDITVDNVDYFYRYNYANGLWQTGQPATSLKMKGVQATNLLGAFNIIGDSVRKFNLSIQNSSFAFREGTISKTDSFEGAKMQSQAFFNAHNFNHIKLWDVTFKKKEDIPVLICKDGNLVSINNTIFITGQSLVPYSITNVTEAKKDGLTINTLKNGELK